MGRTHAQQFANHVLPCALFADPIAFTRAISSGTVPMLLASLWQQAGDDLAPISRVPATTITATVTRRGLYTIAHITPPAPRETGDAAAIVLIGRGDGETRLSTVAYYVIELVLDATGAPRFTVVTRTGREERGAPCGKGPLPDDRWIIDDVFERYAGHTPPPRHVANAPALPAWYWWHLLEGHAAIRAFAEPRDDAGRLAAIRAFPILLLPEIADVGELFGHDVPAKRLREQRAEVLRDPAMADAWQALVQRLSSLSVGSPVASTLRTLPLIGEAGQHGSLTRAQACEAVAVVRSRLAALGLAPDDNHALAQQLFAAAREAEQAPRLARGSASPEGEDPVGRPLFLDEDDLRDCTRAGQDDSFSANEPAFVGHAGLRAGYVAWTADESSAMARITDARWVFRTANAAAYYLRAVRDNLGDGLPPVAPPQLGDEAFAWGGDTPRGRTYIVVVRIGRVIARLAASEGMHAASSRQILHAATLHPFVGKIVQRARHALAAYWLAVLYPTNAVPALMHSPGHDAARLLAKYPLLALADLPAAITTLGDTYAPVAQSLASFQAQVRAHRWDTYRDAMLGLVRALLTTDMGDMRVNAAHAHEIVTELRYLDPDPVWQQLDVECAQRS